MNLIVGLGNPGRKYERNRHNVGFMTIGAIAARHDVKVNKRSFKAQVGMGSVAGKSVILAVPETFMNLSGESVVPLLGYYKLAPDNLICIHDEMDLELGTVRIVKGAGPGGHNGVGSIINLLGSKDFIRIRVGVGRPIAGMDPADYVLSPFAKSEMEVAAKSIEMAADSVEEILKNGLAAAQQRFHTATNCS